MTRQELMWQEQEVTEFNIQVIAPSGGLVPDQTLHRVTLFTWDVTERVLSKMTPRLLTWDEEAINGNWKIMEFV